MCVAGFDGNGLFSIKLIARKVKSGKSTKDCRKIISALVTIPNFSQKLRELNCPIIQPKVTIIKTYSTLFSAVKTFIPMLNPMVKVTPGA